MLKVNHAIPNDDPFIEQRVYDVQPEWHIHDFCQILFGLRGESILEMEGHMYRTCAMHGVIVPYGMRHDFVGNNENCQLVLDLPLISVAAPQSMLDKAQAFNLSSHTKKMLQMLGSGAARPRQYNWLLAVQLIDQTLLSLGGVSNDFSQFPVKDIELFLRRNMHRSIYIHELATQFGWKSRRFHDLFYHAFGDTPQHYHTRLKLDYALKLLVNPTLKIVEIAHRLGYSDQQSFTHSFSARFGISPAKWRHSLLGTASKHSHVLNELNLYF